MLIRAVIVLLLILNIGIAAWWLARPSPKDGATASAAATLSPDIPRLLLADEAPAARAADPAQAPTSASQAATTTARFCGSYGPFASAEEAAQARQRLQPAAARVAVRAQEGPPYRGWKVWLPPFEEMDEVEAVSARVAEAGFKDQFIVREGRDARSLALGRFGAQAPARQHADKLVAAGFPARADPIGSGAIGYWLDVTAAAADPQRLSDLPGATEARQVDCATWR